jgi:hypothetical protein
MILNELISYNTNKRCRKKWRHCTMAEHIRNHLHCRYFDFAILMHLARKSLFLYRLPQILISFKKRSLLTQHFSNGVEKLPEHRVILEKKESVLSPVEPRAVWILLKSLWLLRILHGIIFLAVLCPTLQHLSAVGLNVCTVVSSCWVYCMNGGIMDSAGIYEEKKTYSSRCCKSGWCIKRGFCSMKRQIGAYTLTMTL